MQRTLAVLIPSLLAGLVLTGCPDKKAEKEAPATADEPAAAAADQSGVPDEKKAGDKPVEKAEPEKEEPEEEKDEEGGW